MSTQYYCVGFAFSEDRTHVLLLRKNRPAWQAGKLNGVGGKVEEGEPPLDAMVREFREETGILTVPAMWRDVGAYRGPGFWIGVFATETDLVWSARAVTDEVPILLPLAELAAANGIPNLQWLIPLCLDRTTKKLLIEEV